MASSPLKKTNVGSLHLSIIFT